MLLSLLCLSVLACVLGAPFVTVWDTTQANQTVKFPAMMPSTTATINWGDNGPTALFAAGVNLTNITHLYAMPGSHTISVIGEFRWATDPFGAYTLVDIVSWGDGFLIDRNSKGLFKYFNKLRAISAPSNTQPRFLPGASLESMFENSDFNSSLDWDLANVTSLARMFYSSSFNQPITFRNTQGVTTMERMFSSPEFNQPVNFDASNVLQMNEMFSFARKFNSPVTLTNSRRVTTMERMFWAAGSFNQPLSIQTDSVQDMSCMFCGADNFNQPVNFNTTQVTTMGYMFEGADRFNQPINFNPARNLYSTYSMFQNAKSFNKPVMIDTTKVSDMEAMFFNATSFASTITFTPFTATNINMNAMFVNAPYFEQNLASWNVSNVASCASFCDWCGLPNFTRCTPCQPIYPSADGMMRICQNGTRAPTPVTLPPTTFAPTFTPGAGPSSPSSSFTTSTAAASSTGGCGSLAMLTLLLLLLDARVQ